MMYKPRPHRSIDNVADVLIIAAIVFSIGYGVFLFWEIATMQVHP